MSGEDMSLEEIMEIAIPVLVFLTIGSAILLISDTDFLFATSAAKETSYVASLVSGTGIDTEIKYENLKDAKIDNENKINILINDLENPVKSTYYGQEVEIESENNLIVIKS